jgi:hypothetical protein
MYRFWDFAFLPVVPLNAANLSKAGGILLEVFVNPLNLVFPAWHRVGVVLPLALAAVGGVSLARRSPSAFLLLVLPILLAMAASAMKRYPLHGRLILELVPAFFLLIAEGTECLGRVPASGSRLLFAVVVAFLLAYPCPESVFEVAGARFREFNRHGDLHRNIFVE